MSLTIRVLNRDHLQELISMKVAIEAVKTGYQQYSKRKVVSPLRMHLPVAEANAVGLIMPVYAPHFKQMSIKVANIFPENPGKYGLPTTNAVLMLFDATNGRLLSLMDGEFLTALRTGAASALATDWMASQKAQIGVVFGAGKQAEMQLKGMAQVRPLEKVFVLSRDAEKGKKFVHRMEKEIPAALEWTVSREVIKTADIICTATTSHTPVFSDEEIKAGVHINGVGSFRPDMVEIPPETITRARVVVDIREACLREAGEIVEAIKHGFLSPNNIPEIGEVITRQIPVREREEDITFFKSVGHAVQDLTVASTIFAKAQQEGVGEFVNL